jgi:hypothetical protein
VQKKQSENEQRMPDERNCSRSITSGVALPCQNVQRGAVGGRWKDPRRRKGLLEILANALKQGMPRKRERGKWPEGRLAHGQTSARASKLNNNVGGESRTRCEKTTPQIWLPN